MHKERTTLLAVVMIGLIACGRERYDPYKFPAATNEGRPETVCDAAHRADAVFLARSQLLYVEEVPFPSSRSTSWMTSLAVSDIVGVAGDVAFANEIIRIRGGITPDGISYAGNVGAVADGGTGIWFCDLFDRELVVRGGGLLFQASTGWFYGEGFYSDAGLTLADVTLMANWTDCNGRVFPSR